MTSAPVVPTQPAPTVQVPAPVAAAPAVHPSFAYAGGPGGFTAGALPPGGRILPTPPPPPPPAPAPANGMLDRRALLLVAVAIGIGAVGMGVSYLLGRDPHLEPESVIRYAIVITLGVYVVVGGLLVTQLTPNVRLIWRVGNPWLGGALGLAVGAGLGLMMLLAISGITGHLSSDSRVVTIMSEGDVAHIGVAVLLTCICAPLVEEVLFRGLLLESLRTRGAAFGIWMSGIAFAVWHLNPGALRYYALMGALFGFLYVKRGLVCSMAAHAGFNGVLTIAAIVIVLAPMKTYHGFTVSAQAPGGWSQDRSTTMDLSLSGPSGAWFGATTVDTPTAPDEGDITARLEAEFAGMPGYDVQLDQDTVRTVEEPAGRGVEIDVTVEGHSGHMVFFPQAGQSVEVVFLSAGSLKAEHDFTKMLSSLRVGG